MWWYGIFGSVSPLYAINVCSLSTTRIEPHICITFVAYEIYKELERQLKELKARMTPETAIETAKSIYTIKVMKPKSKEPSERVLLLNDGQKKIFTV